MREPKCALNLPSVIVQTSGSKRHRPPIAATDQSASCRYGRKPGIAVSTGRHIFNRSFRNDVNAGVSETVGMGISMARDEALTSWSLLAFVQSALQDIELPGISQELSGTTLPVIVAEVMY
jgi:hypothetical protein